MCSLTRLYVWVDTAICVSWYSYMCRLIRIYSLKSDAYRVKKRLRQLVRTPRLRSLAFIAREPCPSGRLRFFRGCDPDKRGVIWLYPSLQRQDIYQERERVPSVYRQRHRTNHIWKRGWCFRVRTGSQLRSFLSVQLEATRKVAYRRNTYNR